MQGRTAVSHGMLPHAAMDIRGLKAKQIKSTFNENEFAEFDHQKSSIDAKILLISEQIKLIILLPWLGFYLN